MSRPSPFHFHHGDVTVSVGRNTPAAELNSQLSAIRYPDSYVERIFRHCSAVVGIITLFYGHDLFYTETVSEFIAC